MLVERDGGVVRLTLNRPAVHNAFDTAMRDAPVDTLRAIAFDPSVEGVVLAGAGPSFSSGGDLRMSGLSKQRDFGVTQEVLRAYGDMVKDAMKQVLRAVAEARQDEVSIDVSGMDEFDIGDFSSELDDAQRLLGLGIDSPTLKKQIFKKLALKYLCDARQDIKGQIAAEIDK